MYVCEVLVLAWKVHSQNPAPARILGNHSDQDPGSQGTGCACKVVGLPLPPRRIQMVPSLKSPLGPSLRTPSGADEQDKHRTGTLCVIPWAPGSVLSAWDALSGIFIITLRGRWQCGHFTEKETEAWRGKATCLQPPRSLSGGVGDPRIPKPISCQHCAFPVPSCLRFLGTQEGREPPAHQFFSLQGLCASHSLCLENSSLDCA